MVDMDTPKRNPSIYENISIEDEAQKLVGLCGQMHIDIEDSQAKELIEYLQLVLIKNCSLNLTAIREWDKALVLHLLDSLTLLQEFDAQEEYIQELQVFHWRLCARSVQVNSVTQFERKLLP